MAVVISPDSLRALGSDQSYERGLAYANDGRVGTVSQHGRTVRATVAGREPYGVRLDLDENDDALTGHCSCPMGAEGAFCKHCVAVAIVWSAHGPEYRIEAAVEPKGDYTEQARNLSRDDLVELVAGQAEQHPGVAAELCARAGILRDPDDSTVQSMRARIAEVLSDDEAADPEAYYEAEALVEELAFLVHTAASEAVVALVEETMRRWTVISVLGNDMPEVRDLEVWLTDILQEARHLLSVRNDVAG